MSSKPELKHHYDTRLWNSGRWSGYTPRDGDIIVCTSYKAGTTWTQMICAMLVHQTPKLPMRLAQLSRWMDMQLQPVHDVLAGFEAQEFRRIIKTHTPLDGLPYFENVSYVYCGRDPRDVFMSMQHHSSNLDMQRAAGLLMAQGIRVEPPPPMPEDLNERFTIWISQGVFPWEHDGAPYWSTLHHVRTFWEYRHLPNVHFHHFADLKQDLEGQMRRLATFLEIEVAEDKWPELVQAATFDHMKANAEQVAPEADHGIWKSTSGFFNKGENDQWRAALSKENQELYQRLTRERYDAEMLEWMENGSMAGVRPGP
jgi:aryl sulfotransferase